jgi:hypothetical protein
MTWTLSQEPCAVAFSAGLHGGLGEWQPVFQMF